MPPREAVDVIVVGAGPTGLTVGILLAARGVRVIVVEQRMTTSDEPKAISLDDESLRTYQQAGVAEQILPILVPGTGTTYYDADGELLFDARSERPHRLGYPFKNPFAQPELERVLAVALQGLPTASLRFGHRLTDLDADAGGVTATVENGDGQHRVRAAFVIGADGGRSAVRALRGIAMTGRSYSTPWLVIDAVRDPHTERFGMHHADPTRPHVIVPGLEGRCRYEFLLFDGEGEPGTPPDFDVIRKLLSRYREIGPGDVERAVIYTFHGLIADRWQDDRVFLMGDAAHMMPPFAGQGLNSGLRDAANLSWKLADVIHGFAPRAILDSYEPERRPHVEATVRASEKLGRIVMTTSERLARHRDRLLRRALATREGREFFEKMRYRPIARLVSGLVLPDSEPQFAGLAIPQPLVFDGALRRMVLLDEVLGRGWAVVGVDVSGADWRAVGPLAHRLRAVRAHVDLDERHPQDTDGVPLLIDLDGRLLETALPHRGHFLLLRPDHFIAARWAPHETPSVHESTADWTRSPREETP